jgi:hypothetical protein
VIIVAPMMYYKYVLENTRNKTKTDMFQMCDIFFSAFLWPIVMPFLFLEIVISKTIDIFYSIHITLYNFFEKRVKEKK